ncbi:MAG: hypothetical protein SGI88_15310 [Candidatus Hydrogenedentes bacterium]|nr:hypothetical protein [Candidatus Hydrogenedentota bacterium]
MHRVPNGRRFGSPEALLIFAALAIVVPLTAWWHAYCTPDGPLLSHARVETVRGGGPVLAVPPDAQAFTVVGYVMSGQGGRPVIPEMSDVAPSVADPNLVILFVLSALGVVVAGFYSFGVYPGLRGTPRGRWM